MRHCAASTAKSVGVLSKLLRCGFLLTLLLVGTAWGSPATVAEHVTLTPLSPATPASGAIEIQPGAAITLSISKQSNGAGVPNQAVDWNVSGPGSATLSSTRSMISAKDETHEARTSRRNGSTSFAAIRIRSARSSSTIRPARRS